MPTSTVDFGAGGIHSTQSYDVALHAGSGLPVSWTVEAADNYQCTQCVWSAAPSMPTARLVFDYGQLRRRLTDAVFTHSQRPFDLTALPTLVRIRFSSGGAAPNREWYGTIDLSNDLRRGAAWQPDTSDPKVISGHVHATAYGLEKLLADHEIKNSVYVPRNSGTVEFSDRLLTFNDGGKPNRSKFKFDGTYVFGDDPDLMEYWSTENIVEYLLKWHTPKDPFADGLTLISFQLPDDHLLPKTDRPVIEQLQLRTYDVLDRLVNRRRLLLWWLEVATDPARVLFKTASMLDTKLEFDVPGVADMPAAKEVRNLKFDLDQLTSATLKESTLQRVNRVIVRGARRRSIGSFSNADGNLVPGWDSADETAYTNAASGESGYGTTWGTKKKQDRNHEVRNDARLRQVFSTFIIPKEWDFRTADGIGGSSLALFQGRDPERSGPRPIYYPDMEIAQTLSPLVQGVDYSSDKISGGTFTLPAFDEQFPSEPILVFRLPEDNTKWVAGEAIAKQSEVIDTEKEFSKWSATVSVPRDGKGIRVAVSGTHRHVIDAANFGYLDDDTSLGKWTYKDNSGDGGMIATLAVLDDKYCEGVAEWPLVNTIGPRKEKTIYVGDLYRKDWVANNTVVGVNTDGTLKTTLGGYIPKEGSDDDESKLEAVAKIMIEWYGRDHYVLQLRTMRNVSPEDIQLGDLIGTIGDASYTDSLQTINSSVTEIAIESPIGNPDIRQAPTTSITTFSGELDPLLLLPPPAAATGRAG